MKNIKFLLLILISCFIFTACDNNSNSNIDSNNDKNKETINKEEENNNSEEKQEETREKYKYSEEEYKALCEKLNYKTIARSPESNKGKKIYGTGEIIQVVEENNEYAMFRINVTPVMNYNNTDVSYYEDTILAYTYDYDMNNRLLEDDIIDFWGIAAGNYTYETVLGSSLTVPLIQIDYYSLK